MCIANTGHIMKGMIYEIVGKSQKKLSLEKVES